MKRNKENSEDYGYEQAVREMREVLDKYGDDAEATHSHADSILCRLLLSWGFDEIVELYSEVPKWFA